MVSFLAVSYIAFVVMLCSYGTPTSALLSTVGTGTGTRVVTIRSPFSTALHADIVDTAVTNGSFKTLTNALDSVGLVETLKGEGDHRPPPPINDPVLHLLVTYYLPSLS